MSALQSILLYLLFHSLALALPARVDAARAVFSTSVRVFASYEGVTPLPATAVAPSSTLPKETDGYSMPLLVPTLVFETKSSPSSSFSKETVVSSVSLLVPTFVSESLPPSYHSGTKFIVVTSSTGSTLLPLSSIESTTLAPSSTVSVSDHEGSTPVIVSPSTPSALKSSQTSLSRSETSTLPGVSSPPSDAPTDSGGSLLGIDPVLLLYIVIPPCCLLVLAVLGFGLFLCIRRIMRLRRLQSHLMPLRDMEGSEDSDDDSALDNDASFTVTSTESSKPVLRFHE